MADQTDFSSVFLKRVDDIERRALRAGTSLTAICKAIGISRATPDRWRRQVPRTIAIVDEMENWVDEIEKKRETVSA
jgi:transposase-like protein